jgi:arsenate reductase
MGEALLKMHAGERFDGMSAGVEPGVFNLLTRRVMAEIGVDTAGQYAKGLDQFRGKVAFDYLITVCDHAARNCPVFPGAANRPAWSFEDPAAAVASGDEAAALAKFRNVRDRIDARLRLWLREQGILIPWIREDKHMVTIKVLGSGCATCRKLEELARQAVAGLAVEAQVIKVRDAVEFAHYQLLATPGLVVDEKLVSAGCLPSIGEICSWLADAVSVPGTDDKPQMAR